MLSWLRVRGLALLEDAKLELEPGLNVITGETGAGKSMVVGGLGLLRGAKGSRDSVRAGSAQAEIEAEFVVASGKLRVERTIARHGRSKSSVQGRLTPLPALAVLGAELFEITSQHEHQSLTSPARQLGLVDELGELGAPIARYSERYRELLALRQAGERLAESERTRALRSELVRHHLEELEELAPELGELARLEERVRFLREARRWSELASEARHVLVEDDLATLPRVSGLCRQLMRASTREPCLRALADNLEAVHSAAEEAGRAADKVLSALEIAPGELEQSEQRLAELTRLATKHGVHADQLPELSVLLARELGELDGVSDALEQARQRLAELEAQCCQLAEGLHQRRVSVAERLAAALSSELGALCMPEARVCVRVERLSELGPHGVTRAEIELAANPGEPLAPLARVASGGELSRLLLALRSVVRRGSGSTYVFDEVDAGVGGRVAEAIGVRLKAISRCHQVLCITHLPQIAAFADAHFAVEKSVEQGRTLTRVTRLNEALRIAELARMLGGSERSARAHAEALLEGARRPHGPAAVAHTRPHRRHASARAATR